MSRLLVPKHHAAKRLIDKAKEADARNVVTEDKRLGIEGNGFLGPVSIQGRHEIYDLDTPVPEGVPTPHRYLVLVMPVMVKSKIGSIFLPDQAVDDQLWINGLGKVCAVGPGVYKGRRYEEMGLSPDAAPKIGDIVIYNAKSPNRITVDGRKLLFVNDDGLFGTVKPEDAHRVQF